MNIQQFLFDFFTNPNAQWVLLGVISISVSAGMVGTFAYLRKQSLVGDALSHAILPGIAIAFMLTHTKQTWILLLGATIAGALALASIDYIVQQTKLKSDTAISVVLSVFFGLGTFLLTKIQQDGRGEQSGLDKFLLGRVASLVWEDVLVLGLMSLFLLILLWWYYPLLRLWTFDMNYAQSVGFKLQKMRFLFSFMMILSVSIGIQAVGVILMSALLITPAASARYWTNNLRNMLIIAGFFGAIAGFFGAIISFSYPKTPTGASMVMVLALIAMILFFFGKK
jgi:manganese/zinc/iron transport system permease protein